MKTETVTHTPGPWAARGTVVTEMDGTRVASSGFRGWYDRERANARLIAAAPDMLEACREADAALADEGYDAESQVRLTVRAAIAKACA